MRRRIVSLICFVIGHDFGDWTDDCHRCGQDLFDCVTYAAKTTIPDSFRYWRWRTCQAFNFFRRCPECGKRFCKLPDDDIHIPF